MLVQQETSHSIDGTFIPVGAEHSREGGGVSSPLIWLGSVATLVAWFFEASYWAYFPIAILAGVAIHIYLTMTYQQWRAKPISNHDVYELRHLLKSAQLFEIRLSPLPAPTHEMTQGELEDWAIAVNQELQEHYRRFICAEADEVAKQVSS